MVDALHDLRMGYDLASIFHLLVDSTRNINDAESFGGNGIFLIATLYGAIFAMLGRYFWNPAGIIQVSFYLKE